MSCRVARFQSLPWAAGAHPLERKRGPVDEMVVLEFAPGFEDPNWCTRSHVIYVLEGELEVRLDASVERVVRGDAVALDAGARHRVLNPGEETCRLFVVSDLAREHQK